MKEIVIDTIHGFLDREITNDKKCDDSNNEIIITLPNGKKAKIKTKKI